MQDPRPPASLLVVGLLLFALAPTAPAHYLGESYLFLRPEGSGFAGHVDLPLAEIGDVLSAGEVTDGVFTPAEVDESIERLRGYVEERVGLVVSGQPVELEFNRHDLLTTGDVPFVKLYFTADVPGEIPDVITVRFSALFDAVPGHRALLVLQQEGATDDENETDEVALIFDESRTEQELDLRGQPGGKLFWTYLEHGVHHIAIGLDHVLFILALLLTSVLQRDAGRWVATPSFRRAFLNVVTIVTLFTVAHSITLTLAALQILSLPVRFVESVIAFTVLLAALHNLYPVLERRAALFIFLFGLFHGVGFASVLTSLGFKELSMVWTLLGFNIGVELGQLLIVCAVFPILYMLRARDFYVRWVMGAGSCVVAAVGALWLVQRSFDL